MEVVCIPFAPYVTNDMCIRERKVQTADALIKVATYVHTQTRLTPYTHLSVGICFSSFRFSSLLFPSRLQRTNERMNECTNGTLTSVEEEVSLPANVSQPTRTSQSCSRVCRPGKHRYIGDAMRGDAMRGDDRR